MFETDIVAIKDILENNLMHKIVYSGAISLFIRKILLFVTSQYNI